MRVFWALAPGSALRDALDRVAMSLPVGRAVPRENLHLTLAFLGEIGPDAAEAFHECIAGEVLAAPVLRVTGLELWGGRRPGVLVARVAQRPELSRLHQLAGRAARTAGIGLERRRFRPHVTLARFGKGLDQGAVDRVQVALAGVGDTGWPAQTADSAGLWQSRLTPHGAVHEQLVEYPLVQNG